MEQLSDIGPFCNVNVAMNKSLFSFLRQLSMSHCSHLLLSAVALLLLAADAVNQYLLPTQRSASNMPRAAAVVK